MGNTLPHPTRGSSIKSGIQSKFDRFHTEKCIAKRLFHGGSEFKKPKPKSGEKKRKDKERYRAWLNRFVITSCLSFAKGRLQKKHFHYCL